MEHIRRGGADCGDTNCPFHGSLSVRGRSLQGVVVSDKMDKSVVVGIDYVRFHSKYERYSRMSSRITAHNPPCVAARAGDRVTIVECRPISKTKAFVVVKKET